MAETKAKLITADGAAFGEKRLTAASIDDLASNVGLKRGAFYYNFGVKVGLLAAVIDQMAIVAEVQKILLLESPAFLGAPKK